MHDKLALVLLVSGSFIHQKLGEPKLYDNYVTVNEMGIPIQVEQLPNPQYIEGTPRIVLEVLSDLLPSGQAIQLTDAFDTEGMTDESIAKALQMDGIFSVGDISNFCFGNCPVSEKRNSMKKRQ